MDYRDGYLEGYRQGYDNGWNASRIAQRGIMPMLPQDVPVVDKKPKRRARRKDPKLSKAFKEANARLRTKSGKLRKGRTQADVARLAQRLRKKM